MAIISIRLNDEEEKMITFLTNEYEKDKSSLIKYSLQQLYEDSIDKKLIEEYEDQENKKKGKFFSAEEIEKEL